MAKRVRLTLGHRQAEALFVSALMGIEDMRDIGDSEDADRADSALTVLARAMRTAKEA
jgi:hypothetical protein